MAIKAIPALTDNYIWAINDESNQQTVIVDPGEAAPVIDFLQQERLRLAGILITHHHWDHTNGVAQLVTTFSAPVFNAANSKNQVVIPGFPYRFEVIRIPGHTLDHTAYYGDGNLFSGDTLFSAGCGRVFEGTPEQMYASLMKLAELPLDTRIYCGHEYTLSNLRFAQVVEPGNAMIKKRYEEMLALRNQGLPTLPSLLRVEKETNPFLRCGEREVIERVQEYAGMRLDDAVLVFTWLRKWKNEFV